MGKTRRVVKQVVEAARIPVPLTPCRSMIRLPLIDALPLLKAGPASIPLPPTITSLEYRYTPKRTSMGSRQFMRQYAPQLAYANPHVPFVFKTQGEVPYPWPETEENLAKRPKKTTSEPVITPEPVPDNPEFLDKSSMLITYDTGKTYNFDTTRLDPDAIMERLLSGDVGVLEYRPNGNQEPVLSLPEPESRAEGTEEHEEPVLAVDSA